MFLCIMFSHYSKINEQRKPVHTEVTTGDRHVRVYLPASRLEISLKGKSICKEQKEYIPEC